jgi:DNA repair exonuclease SbcCD ATPase subunit
MRRLCCIVVLAALACSSPVALAEPAVQASVSTLVGKGQAELRAGRFREALRLGEGLVAKYPKRYEGYRLVGAAALRLDQPDRAERAFRQALPLAPVAARAGLQGGLREAKVLRQALRDVARAEALKESGDFPAAAGAQESAYQTVPARSKWGFSAAELFERAGRMEEAQRVLEDLRERNPTGAVAAQVRDRLASLQTRIEAARKDAADELARKEAEEQQAAEARREEEEQRKREAERRRLEEERKAEEERRRAERARYVREETERLNGLLRAQRANVDETESALRRGRETVNDAERTVREVERDADSARSRRDEARRRKDEIEGKLRDAKGEIARQVYRDELRSAESKYNEADSEYSRASRRVDEAKSYLSRARNYVDEVRNALDRLEQDIRDTQAALSRLAGGI